jgi:hypothetical protein
MSRLSVSISYSHGVVLCRNKYIPLANLENLQKLSPSLTNLRELPSSPGPRRSRAVSTSQNSLLASGNSVSFASSGLSSSHNRPAKADFTTADVTESMIQDLENNPELYLASGPTQIAQDLTAFGHPGTDGDSDGYSLHDENEATYISEPIQVVADRASGDWIDENHSHLFDAAAAMTAAAANLLQAAVAQRSPQPPRHGSSTAESSSESAPLSWHEAMQFNHGVSFRVGPHAPRWLVQPAELEEFTSEADMPALNVMLSDAVADSTVVDMSVDYDHAPLVRQHTGTSQRSLVLPAVPEARRQSLV